MTAGGTTVRVVHGALALLVLAYAATAGLGVGDAPLADALYYGVLAGVVAMTLLRAVLIADQRGAWLAFAAALLCWTAADLCSTFLLDDATGVPIPSVADGLYLAFYPLAFAGVVLLVRGRLLATGATVWLDGLVVALSTAALGALLLAPPIADATGGPALEVATNLAYPLGDLLLALTIAGVIAVGARRMARGWLLLLGALLLFAITDATYLYQEAAGTYRTGGPLDAGWPLAFLLFGAAAWQPVDLSMASPKERRSVVLPAAFGLISVGLLVLDHFARLETVVVCASAAALVAILARFVLTFQRSQQLIADRRRQALTDPVTELRNRRALMLDLDARVTRSRTGRTTVLTLFDLDGFKQYNDTFGHPAGDLLLIRLAHQLRIAAAEQNAAAYRMGGDEFCVLAVVADDDDVEPLVALATAALAEHGEGFAITASAGYALIAHGDTDVVRALKTADDRMYAAKSSRRLSALRQTRAVLNAVLDARDPQLAGHLDGVAVSAERVARHLGLSEIEIRQVCDAAQLHDIGKIAIPDAILHKPGPLDESDWEFMRRHTTIGERIVAAAPSLKPIAPFVRSHHERWDGTGYPDRLAGDAIPLGAQIIFVCDAFDAMTSDRPYRAAMPRSAALMELRAGAGRQFSPAIVRAFCESSELTVTAPHRAIA